MSTSSSEGEDEVTVIEVLDQSINQSNSKRDKKNNNKHKYGKNTDNEGPTVKENNMRNKMEEGCNNNKRLRKQYNMNHEDLNQDVTTTEKWLETVKAGGELTLSPFSGANLGNPELKDEGDSLSLQDELLVDISGIQPAGHNKSLFSIDEDSQEGSPSKGGFQQVDLTDSETLSMPTSPQEADPGGVGAGGGGFKFNQGIAGVTFDPTSPSATLSPLSRPRRDSTGSTMSDASSLFPIYEVPGVSFNMPQSDLESSSEWEDGSSGAVDRLSKDTVYQAYLKMRQRYHKYKGRYSDLARAYKEKEKESEKLRDVLTKTQDKALRKVQLLQDGLGAEVLNAARHNSETENQVQTNSEGTQTLIEEHKIEENGRIPSCDEGDNVSVASQCSTMTNMEQDEIIEKLKVTMEDVGENISSDVVKHKALLSRCMENIRTNKEKITTLTAERDLATQQLQDKIKQIDLLKKLGKKEKTLSTKEENEKELEGLRFNVESSALSMAETKKQLFEELQNKEASVECFKKQAEDTESSAAQLEEKWALERSKWEEEEHRWKEERSKWEQDLQSKQAAIEDKERIIEEQTRELRIFKESSSKENSSMDQIKEEIQLLEARTKDLKEGRTKLQAQVQELDTLKGELEKKVDILEEEKVEHEKKLSSVETKSKEDLETIATLNKQNEYLKEKQSNISSANKDLECDKNKLLEKLKTFENSQRGAQQKLNGLESSTAQMAKEMSQLQESNQQMDNKVKQLERKKKELENQLEEEQSTKEELENQLKELESKKNDSKSKIEKSDKEISSLSQEVQALQEENKKQKESILKLEGENKELEKNLHSSKDQSTKESEEKIRIQKELISFKTEKESLQGNLEQNKSDAEKLSESIKDHVLEIDNLKTSKNSLLKELEAKNTEISTIKDSIEKLRIEKEKVLKKSEEYRIENEKVNKQIKTLHSECDHLKAEKNRLNSEIKEKDNKVGALETSLKKETDDHKKEINKLNENLKTIEEERNQYKNKISTLEETVKSKSEEMEKLQQSTSLNSNKLASQVSELEGMIKTKDVELKDTLEDKQKLDRLKEVVIQEKSKMEKEFENLKSEIKRLKEESESKNKDIESKKQEISSLKIVQDTLNQSNKKLSEDHKNKIDKLNVDHKQKFDQINIDHKLSTEQLNEEIKSREEENEKISKKLAELEQEINNNSSLTKGKDTQLADLQKQLVEKEKLFTDQQNKNKEKYKAFSEIKNKMQEKEKSNKEVQAKLNEKEKELSDTKDKLHLMKENLTSFQESIKQKEEKVENILKEKKAVLEEYTNKVGELEGELTKKEQLLKEALKDRETLVESLEKQLNEKETSSAQKIESCLQLQHSLEQKLKETEHKFLEKDQMLVRQKEETKQTEDQWQQRLRFEGIADSLSAKSRHVALFNMLKFSCDVEKVQKQHEDQLALVRSELSKSQQCELEALRDSHTRALQERDASCASLKDQVDQQISSNQDAQSTITDLQTQLADTQHKLKCQSERVEEVEAALEQKHTIMAEVESQVVVATTQQATPQFACDDSQQMETLIKQNEELSEKLRNYENEKQTDAKNIAMLEFNNEHNKQKVINMEISHKALVEKYAGTESERAELEKQLREGSKDIIDKITAQAEEATVKLEAEKEKIIEKLTLENEELTEKLSRGSEELRGQYENKQKDLTDQVDGLTEIKQSFEKQIKQIEKNNEEMHANIGVVQLHRNEARTEAAQLKKEGELLKEELVKLGEAKASLEQDLQGCKDDNIDLQDKVSSSNAEVSNLGESIRTLENNLTNLQKQLEATKKTNAQLTETCNAEKKAKVDIEEKIIEEKKQYKEKLSALENKLSTTKEELATDNSNTQVIGTSDEPTETKNLLRITQEKLRLAEMLNSEVDEYRERIRSLEGKMATMEDNHRQQLHNISQESDRQIAKKCEEYQQTLTSAYDQQDSETHSLIKSHQTTLQDAQQQVKEKTNVMENAQKDYEAKLKYEDQIASLQLQHETHIKQVEATWRARTEKMVKQREGQLQEEMDGLAEEWNKERKELERLTQVAACAFRSGSDSVELLKKQVSAQRKELDQVKTTHKFETARSRQYIQVMLILWVSLGIFLLMLNFKSTSTNFIWEMKAENQIYIGHQQNWFGLYNSAYPLTPWVRDSTGIVKFEIAVIADMDMYSKHPTEENTWISYVKKGHLSVCMARKTVTVVWEKELQILKSRMSYGGRGMELSELIVFNGKLYSFDDRTGIVYEINLSSNKATPWVILADGNGREVKGFKSEWATVKDNSLIVGGIGRDWTSPNGDVMNSNPQWIKVITPSGLITHHNWTQYYEKLRQSVGIYFPGYMIHESCIWSDVWQRWMFLPRKMSTIPYDYTFDQQHAGTNLMLQATENFENVEVTYVGDKVEAHGFSTFKFVPGLNDEVIVAVKTIEKDGNTASYIMAFDINSNILMPETKIFDCKFEGIEFI